MTAKNRVPIMYNGLWPSLGTWKLSSWPNLWRLFVSIQTNEATIAATKNR